MTTYSPKPDPATAALLRKIAETNQPNYSEVSVAQARQMSIDSGRAIDIAAVEVGRVEDKIIEGPGGPLTVRCYWPTRPAEGPWPALVYFHGGGFVIGSIDTHDPLCRALCQGSGAVVVSVDYRLAPEHPFPAAVQDAFAAWRWLAGPGAAELGVAPDRIAVGGDSAGGTLAAVITQVGRNEGRRLAAQVLFYPVVDMAMSYPSYAEFATMPPISRDVLAWFWSHYFGGTPTEQQIRHLWASPMRVASFAGLPPAFVLTAGQDPLRDEGEAYAKRLSSEGVEVTYMCCMGTIHAFLRMGKAIPATLDAIDAAASFLKRRLAAPSGG